MTSLRVLLVTSWQTPCGIAEYAAQLEESVEAADPGIEVYPSAACLDPDTDAALGAYQLVHLNHHDALHSGWQPDHVQALVDTGVPVVVTYHDTRDTLAACPKLEALAAVASAVIVHEPVEGLEGSRIHYWRQGVPAAAQLPAEYNHLVTPTGGWRDGEGRYYLTPWKAFPQQPVLGTCGFNFPWKNFDRIAQETEKVGWACVICSTNATEADEARWKGFNPSTLVVRGHLPTPVLVNYLAGCDATAFMYECANTGTSGAIRMGIAARKPVIAFRGCRQFRDLRNESALTFIHTWDMFHAALVDYLLCGPGQLVELAHRDSWTVRGRQHADLYRSLVHP